MFGFVVQMKMVDLEVRKVIFYYFTHFFLRFFPLIHDIKQQKPKIVKILLDVKKEFGFYIDKFSNSQDTLIEKFEDQVNQLFAILFTLNDYIGTEIKDEVDLSLMPTLLFIESIKQPKHKFDFEIPASAVRTARSDSRTDCARAPQAVHLVRPGVRRQPDLRRPQGPRIHLH